MRSSKSRSRSKANRPRTLGNIINRVFDSSGPEGKVRGTPQQIIEKYQMLARDAQLSNDRVAAENFLQHAEHYTRLLAEAMREMAAEQESRVAQTGGQNGWQNRGDGRADQPRSDAGDMEQPYGAAMDMTDGDAPLVDLPESDRAPQPAPRQFQPRQQRPNEGRQNDGRPFDNRQNNRPRDDRPRDDRPRDDRPKEDRARDDKPRDDRPRDDRARDDKPRDERPREDRPRNERAPRPAPVELRFVDAPVPDAVKMPDAVQTAGPVPAADPIRVAAPAPAPIFESPAALVAQVVDAAPPEAAPSGAAPKPRAPRAKKVVAAPQDQLDV